jgi:hypothetical protein
LYRRELDETPFRPTGIRRPATAWWFCATISASSPFSLVSVVVPCVRPLEVSCAHQH